MQSALGCITLAHKRKGYSSLLYVQNFEIATKFFVPDKNEISLCCRLNHK